MADEMDLKTFISSSWCKWSLALMHAMQEIRKQGLSGVINPTGSGATYSDQKDVQFDVAVTVTDTKSGGGNAGIKIASIQIGAKGEMSTASHPRQARQMLVEL